MRRRIVYHAWRVSLGVAYLAWQISLYLAADYTRRRLVKDR